MILPDDQHPIAVVLHFMDDPVRPQWDLLAGNRQARLIRHTHEPKIGTSAAFYELGTSSNGARSKAASTIAPWSERHSEMQRPQRMNVGPFNDRKRNDSRPTELNPSSRPDPKSNAPRREQTFPKVGGLSFPQAEVAWHDA